ncbi:hypothetical protein ACFCYB_00515 [Streptomyces sp. NPDC056309]|uniref:hypothetical protein n=1 Tax=Streptomyces sp. NPDC056309 TaxID=3345781 RepID=UPI0035E0D572
MATSSQTQISAALALTQLLTEYPELPHARWAVERDGLLSGTIAIHADMTDLHEGMRAYAAVLGGSVHEQHFQSPDGGPSLSVSLYATWRDVRVNVWGTCLVSAVSEGSAVAA